MAYESGVGATAPSCSLIPPDPPQQARLRPVWKMRIRRPLTVRVRHGSLSAPILGDSARVHLERRPSPSSFITELDTWPKASVLLLEGGGILLGEGAAKQHTIQLANLILQFHPWLPFHHRPKLSRTFHLAKAPPLNDAPTFVLKYWGCPARTHRHG